MHAYKKRLKGNWRQGKGYKGDAEERQFAKREILDAIAEDDPEFLYRYHSSRTRNLKKSLEHRIQSMQEEIDRLDQRAQRDRTPWGSSYADFLRSYRNDLKRKLAKEFPDG